MRLVVSPSRTFRTEGRFVQISTKQRRGRVDDGRVLTLEERGTLDVHILDLESPAFIKKDADIYEAARRAASPTPKF
jgi:hypothetical protein